MTKISKTLYRPFLEKLVEVEIRGPCGWSTECPVARALLTIYIMDTVIMNTTDADEKSLFDGCLFFQAINEFQSVRSRSFDALG